MNLAGANRRHRWLHDVLDVPRTLLSHALAQAIRLTCDAQVIIMLTDDEKYLFSDKRTIEEVMSCEYQPISMAAS